MSLAPNLSLSLLGFVWLSPNLLSGEEVPTAPPSWWSSGGTERPFSLASDVKASFQAHTSAPQQGMAFTMRVCVCARVRVFGVGGVVSQHWGLILIIPPYGGWLPHNRP